MGGAASLEKAETFAVQSRLYYVLRFDEDFHVFVLV